MKKIVIFLIVSILILSWMNAQQVKNGGSNDTIDSTIIKSDEIDPGYKPKGAPWCEGIEIADGIITYKKITIDGRLVDLTNTINLKKSGITSEVTSADVKWQDFREISFTNEEGKQETRKVAYYIIEKDGASLLIYDKPAFYKNDKSIGIVLRASDNSKIFTHEGAICTLSDGTKVISTPTTLLAIGPTGKKDEKNYDKELGEGPDLNRPTIRRDNIDKFEFARIDDETIPGQYMLYDMVSGLDLLNVPNVGINK
jgi:hypothetical protein